MTILFSETEKFKGLCHFAKKGKLLIGYFPLSGCLAIAVFYQFISFRQSNVDRGKLMLRVLETSGSSVFRVFD